MNDIELFNNTQNLYNDFNNFIMSKDIKVFNKLVARTLLYNKVKSIPGDIVECGVFKGSGLYTFLKLKNLYNPNSNKKVLGFDYFDTKNLLKSVTNSYDNEYMEKLFTDRNFEHSECFKQTLESKLIEDGFKENDFELIQGDVSFTTKEYIESNPGFKISLLYMDVDLEIPTYNTLKNFWDNISVGGLIVLDEYAHHKWSESKGVDKFIREKKLKIKTLNYLCPTAYIKKH